MASIKSSSSSRDVEAGHEVCCHDRDTKVANPTHKYFQREEKLNSFLSQQFPTIANPAALGLCAFVLTTFFLSMYNSGAIVSPFSQFGWVLP